MFYYSVTSSLSAEVDCAADRRRKTTGATGDHSGLVRQSQTQPRTARSDEWVTDNNWNAPADTALRSQGSVDTGTDRTHNDMPTLTAEAVRSDIPDIRAFCRLFANDANLVVGVLRIGVDTYLVRRECARTAVEGHTERGDSLPLPVVVGCECELECDVCRRDFVPVL